MQSKNPLPTFRKILKNPALSEQIRAWPDTAVAAMQNMFEALQSLPAPILALAELFNQKGFELSLVGGPVRDAMLGIAPHDWDLTTNARPEQIQEILEQWGGTVWDMGRAFGTIGAHKSGLDVEITTYRTEQYRLDSRKPEVSFGDSLEGDLERRDFTVNAMALRLPDLTLVDPHYGVNDLLAGELRTPIAAEESFADDPLRIMRAARFAAALNMNVSQEVLVAMKELKSRLEIVSAERICAELKRLIIGTNPRKGIELMVNTGIADLILPELANLRETVDEHKRHKDVYDHTLTVLDQAIDLETDSDGEVPRPDFVLRFAALMHDVGKPDTRKFEAGGQVSFHHHEIVGAKLTRKRMKALRFDKQTTHDVCKLVSLHLRFHGYGEQDWTDSAVRRYVTDAGDMLTRLHRLTRADCTTRNKRKAAYLSHAYDDLEKRIEELAAKEELARIRPDLNGEEIMHILGITPGRTVGLAYKFLLNLRLEKGPQTKEEATEALLNWWKDSQK